MIQTRDLTVTFVSPTFLGDAKQNGVWRSPPFKALLRQWWRVAVAKDFGYDWEKIRAAEGRLFGHAWLADDKDERGRKVAARRSQVRLRLDGWKPGKMSSWDRKGLVSVHHPEVNAPVDAALYLGYGPLNYDRQIRGTILKKSAAIQSGERAVLRLAFPAEEKEGIETALWLMDRFGTIGGRSRNGWGSFVLAPCDGAPLQERRLDDFLCDWQQALGREWPHAIGAKEGKPLVWETEAKDSWKDVITELAKIKIALRTQFRFTTGMNADDPEPRHWLSYPVTHHSVRRWGNSRLPNSLRFKVRPDADGRLRGVIFHMPVFPSRQFGPDHDAVKGVWQRVHTELGKDTGLHRIGA